MVSYILLLCSYEEVDWFTGRLTECCISLWGRRREREKGDFLSCCQLEQTLVLNLHWCLSAVCVWHVWKWNKAHRGGVMMWKQYLKVTFCSCRPLIVSVSECVKGKSNWFLDDIWNDSNFALRQEPWVTMTTGLITD